MDLYAYYGSADKGQDSYDVARYRECAISAGQLFLTGDASWYRHDAEQGWKRFRKDRKYVV